MVNPVTFGSEYAPFGEGSASEPKGSAGSGDTASYPDAHSTVPSGAAERGEHYPYPDAHSTVPSGDAGAGDYPVPQERSTVGPQNVGSGASGPRREYPADKASASTQDYNGGDGGDYRWGIPYSQAMPQTKEWGMYGPDDGGFGHSNTVKNVDFHPSDDWDDLEGTSLHNWGKGTISEAKGYEVLGQERDGPPPTAEVNEAADFDSPGSEAQYPQPEDITWKR